VESASESIEPRADTAIEPSTDGLGLRTPAGSALPRALADTPDRTRLRAAGVALHRARFAILVYLGSRALLFAVAIVNGALRHHALLNELANWDGFWYRWVANGGYPMHVSHLQTTLGFFPLFPLVTWAVARVVLLLTSHSSIWAITAAGVVVSSIGGAVASVIVERLAASWWGRDAGRRAVILFCLFPGSVVFSMVYAEGILIPLAAGCILALQHRRWLLAGVLAGLATASEPEALALVLVCAVSAARELRRRGWHERAARRSLLAPLLSLSGIAAVAAFLWSWTGTPFATLIAQHYGWHERTDPLALVHLAQTLGNAISFSHFNDPTINFNYVVGLAGAIFLFVMLFLLWKVRRLVSIEALVWTLGISFLAVTSEHTPPNPRLLITAFPVVIVLAYYLRRMSFTLFALANGALLAVLSALTFVGITLRP
jgi:hypothetical protein